jgi:hypothetical protein
MASGGGPGKGSYSGGAAATEKPAAAITPVVLPPVAVIQSHYLFARCSLGLIYVRLDYSFDNGKPSGDYSGGMWRFEGKRITGD